LNVYSNRGEETAAVAETSPDDVAAVVAELQDEMAEAAGRLEFERAALLRDQIAALKSGDFRKAAKSAQPAYPKRKRNGFAPRKAG